MTWWVNYKALRRIWLKAVADHLATCQLPIAACEDCSSWFNLRETS